MSSQPSAFKRFLARYIVPLAHHPALTLLTGTALLVTGGAEILETMIEGFEAFMGAHHGIAFLGIVALLRGTAEFIEGMAFMQETTAEESGPHERG